ncbi:hypothetical protein [Rhizobium leguminosarum]|uniref:hypothetical protein n=1 Tax=Rhizobium leguminosarum TaxID=384 RepID=UPI001C97B283|nr:hypothetical protein [Rhizobium leguminosarum]MBY5518472.1 hypothetical protein [Rhizobium leguminosarum]MBY5661255.1 hypothetical protein [Rhizobium leguminosarum]MBY5674289.1 hypothetical protein [Rhizobium leguminosarum]
MRGFILFGIIGVLIFGATASYYWEGNLFGFRYWSWRQKLTLSVQTPDGIVSGSSVTAVSWDMPPEWFKIGESGGGHGGPLKLFGEAVTLEVAPNKYLFALVDDAATELAVTLFASPPLRSGHRDEYARSLDRIQLTAEAKRLTAKQYPRLVTFTDINDPTTVQDVKPSELEEFFGPGVSLNSITLSLTPEPMTDGRVDAALPWLCDYEFRRSGERLLSHRTIGPSSTALKSNRCPWRNYVMEAWGTDVDDKIKRRLCCPS